MNTITDVSQYKNAQFEEALGKLVDANNSRHWGEPRHKGDQRLDGIHGMTYEEANRLMFSIGSHETLGAIFDNGLLFEDYGFRLLGEQWSRFRFIAPNAGVLASFLLDAHTTAMMTRHELRALNQLPEVLTIYRGCGPKGKTGLSWTLSKEVAHWFANRFSYSEPGLLITARIKKSRVIALKLGRDEREVIAWKPKIVSMEEVAEEHKPFPKRHEVKP